VLFCTLVVVTGPIWARGTWGRWWTWDFRLTLTLLLWFVYLGYFMVRRSTPNPDQGKRYSAVVAIVGALLIPFIHLSVVWFRSLHPEPVVIKPEGPTLPGDMLTLLLTSVGVFTTLFLGLFMLRYALEGLRHELHVRARRAAA
jgi:heme exporter protein C